MMSEIIAWIIYVIIPISIFIGMAITYKYIWKTCPYCKKSIDLKAIKCPYCQSVLEEGK